MTAGREAEPEPRASRHRTHASGPGLIVHSFAPLSGAPADRAAARRYLAARWEAAERLGIDEPLLPGVPASFPVDLDEHGASFRVLAAKRAQPRDGATFEAFVFTRHDVAGLSLAMASGPEIEGLEAWAEHSERWRKEAGSEPVPPAMLGECLVFFAVSELGPDRLVERAGGGVRDALRRCGLDCWDPGCATDAGAVVWEGPEEGGRRVLVAIGLAEEGPGFDAWLWWRGLADLAAFPRYLLHAAKTAYEARVHRERRDRVTDLMSRVDAALDDVLELHRELDEREPGAQRRLIDAQRRLTLARADSSGLVIELSHLRSLQRTVSIARDNMESLSPLPTADGETPQADTPFARDLALASWLAGQIEQDIGYAEAVNERAAEANTLTSMRLEAAAETIGRVQARVDLVQTTLLGALLSGLFVVSALSIGFDPPPTLKLPLLASVVALLVAIPPVTAHRHEGYGLFDRLAVGALGASLGWLALVAVWRHAPWPAGIGAAAIGGAVAVVILATLGTVATRGRDRPPR